MIVSSEKNKPSVLPSETKNFERNKLKSTELLLSEKVKVFVNIAEVHLGGYFLPSVAIAANREIVKIKRF